MLKPQGASRTQITLTPAQRYSSHHAASKNAAASGGGAKESHELQGIGGAKVKLAIGSGETIVDDMVYRKTARMIATVDIGYSTIMIVLQLLGLILGASRASNSKSDDDNSKGGEARQSSAKDNPSESDKILETIAVLVWTALFTVCVVQLIVAGALYGGTNERDGRKCIRNCRMWCKTTTFLLVFLLCEILGILVVLHPEQHIWFLILLCSELAFRIVALIYIKKFIKELVIEYCDDDTGGDRTWDRNCETVNYEPLLPPSPVPILKNSINNPNTNYYYAQDQV